MTEKRPGFVARNSDILGVVALLLGFAAAALFASALSEDAPLALWPTSFGITLIGFALAVAAASVGVRGKAAAVGGLIVNGMLGLTIFFLSVAPIAFEGTP